MRFDRFLPCAALQPYVKSLVISETEEEQTYKVLPDTGLVIGFQYRGSLSFLRDRQQVLLSSSGITGIQDRYRLFKNSPHIGTVLVFFKEAGASAFFKQPVHELFGESVSLDNFILRSKLAVLEEQLQEAAADRDKLRVVELFLLSRLNPVPVDPLVVNALSFLHQSKGAIKITELTKQLRISQSTLEKRFRQVVGTTPKKFASLIRFKHALHSHQPEDLLTGLAYEAGFYDQAHFIKEWKVITGETPEVFFKKKG